MSIRILFVDDEPLLLSGLQRLLRPLRKEWTAAFAAGGEEALDILARGTVRRHRHRYADAGDGWGRPAE